MKKWVIAIFVLNLVLRLCFISWHPATYTDSILYMGALERVRGTIILPAYPFAILLLRKIFTDPVVAGRLVSILAASFAVFPLYGLTRIIYNRRAAFFTILLYSVSPLIFRWSLRIFPHGLYSLFVLLFIYGIFKYIETDHVIFLGVGIFLGGIAALTYPTGLVLVPVAVVAAVGYFGAEVIRGRKLNIWLLGLLGGWIVLGIIFFTCADLKSLTRTYLSQVLTFFPVRLPPESLLWQLAFAGGIWLIFSLVIAYLIPGRRNVQGWWYKRPMTLLFLIAAFSSYAFLHIWQNYLSGSFWYQKGMLISYQSLSRRWEEWLTHYLYSYPYIIVYPVALAAILGLILTCVKIRRSPRKWIWLAFYGYFLVGTFYALVVNKWWTTRYQYTLVPLALVFAGYGLSQLWNLKKLRWIGPLSLLVCLGGSLTFTSFVLYWSRESFADISRSALYLRDHYPKRRIFTDELLKTGFFAKRPLHGYTRRSRSTMREGDILVLHGWHTNLRTEYAYLNRFYEMEILNKFPADLVPLLADDVVDWAGKCLRSRANAPVVWDERFRKQHIESWIIDIQGSRDGKDVEPPSADIKASVSPELARTEYAHYFDIGVWEVTREVGKGQRVVMEMAHASGGSGGSFRMEAFTDTDGDGLPDTRVARSHRLEKKKAGQWSRWEFTAPGGPLFVGSSWKLGSWVFFAKPPWSGAPLGEVMYYSRGGMPLHRAHRVGKIKLSFPDREGGVDPGSPPK